jgi:hypothetical protein
MVCAALFDRFFIKHCKSDPANKNKDFRTRRPPKNQGGFQGIFKKVFLNFELLREIQDEFGLRTAKGDLFG